MSRFGSLFWRRSGGDLFRRGNHTKLLHYPQHIDLASALHNPAVRDSLDPDPSHRDALASWRYALKLPGVRGSRPHLVDDLVALSNLILEQGLLVGEGCVPHLAELKKCRKIQRPWRTRVF
jgi:hypothetical protein